MWKMRRTCFIWLVLAAPVALCGCNVAVNRSTTLGDGKTVHSSHHTVNGTITIGSNCDVRAMCESVNGGITVGPDSHVRTLQTVNGHIDLGERVIVHGNVNSVNGFVRCNPGVKIERGISSVNGKVELAGTTVARDIKTCNADVALRGASVVEGSIVVRRRDDDSERHQRLEIRVTDGSVLKGDVVVQDPDVDVAVYLSNGGTVQGRIEGAAVFR
jgi:DUF4097 and DUF4098 domain-containing protein YvlB